MGQHKVKELVFVCKAAHVENIIIGKYLFHRRIILFADVIIPS